MKTKFILFVIILTFSVANAQTKKIFFDDFNGSNMSTLLWHIPTWVSPTDGTYVGKTQFRCSQNSPLPAVSNSQAIINLETYNPTGFSFYGTDLITNRTFVPGNGLIFTIHAKIKSPTAGGIVGGIFLYDLTGSGTTHDEIDFELVTNELNEVHNNIYSDEPLGAGHPDFAFITTPITDYHTYVMKWLPDEVSFIVDGNVIRTSKTLVPDGQLHFHLNMWVPGAEWAEAYDSNLQPTGSPGSNQVYSMIVDSVRVDSLVNPVSVSIIKKEEAEINFYPNPAHDLIYFNTSEKISVSIYNLAGNMILNKREIANRSLSIANLPPGIYLIRCKKNSIVSSSKLIVY
jgi:Glycosyl hydrolases family 16/Secretion system C-terminal sorting domain